MILPTSFIANWRIIRDRRQAATDRNAIRENRIRTPHVYEDGDQVLIVSTNLQVRMARPSQGPFRVVDSSQQNINGTIVVQRTPTTTERINLRRLRPYRPVEDANAV